MTHAELVFTGGTVLTMDSARSRATAVAVTGDRITAVGHAEVRELIGPRTEVVDLAGRALLPGFQDAHIHAVSAGVELGACDLTGTVELAEYLRRIAAYAAEHPRREWITGSGWSMESFPGGLPTRQQLDAIVPDRPVLLSNRDHHGAWANTRALELAGVTADTPDPADGRIEREADGTPSGMLQEGAIHLVDRVVPPITDKDRMAGLLRAQAHLHALGITAWQDAYVSADGGPTDHAAAYFEASENGTLTARVTGAQWWEREQGAEQIPAMILRRKQFRSERFRLDTVKIMQDGIAENYTAAMTVPYKDRHGCCTSNAGLSFVDPIALRDYVTELDALDFQVHFHALGDRAVREALDAVEAALVANGARGNRHHLAHLQVVHADDVARFHRLGAVANLQPLWAAHEAQMDELTLPFMGGDLAERQYMFGDLQRAGATLAAGSDWPVSDASPLAGIHVAVNRRHPGSDKPPLLPEQRLDLMTALAAYTAGSAYVNRRDDTGTLRVGALADLVVLDRDPFEHPLSDIADTEVAQTYVGGARVFG
ncbi:amidohydrolase family protein [Nocardia sp. SYP-A9097]|uniref:amidohydrolase n=1 Tax=Nocardia sp. SYP-A9097 TaxID=2663237 RepID=UPI00129A872B|nr:amidohydrolase [Nocardia sp. SYP-A9097]MRH90239.1 amidohydrolase family protein [Nocardia sp. SYP-A9097]